MSTTDLLAPPNHDSVARAIDAFSSAARGRCGKRLVEIYLFGSRARGEPEPFSDVDLALILAGEDPPSFEETKVLSDLAYDLLLETGVEIQAWPISESEWVSPPSGWAGGLVRSIKREGRAVGVSP